MFIKTHTLLRICFLYVFLCVSFSCATDEESYGGSKIQLFVFSIPSKNILFSIQKYKKGKPTQEFIELIADDHEDKWSVHTTQAIPSMEHLIRTNDLNLSKEDDISLSFCLMSEGSYVDSNVAKGKLKLQDLSDSSTFLDELENLPKFVGMQADPLRKKTDGNPAMYIIPLAMFAASGIMKPGEEMVSLLCEHIEM